MKQFIKKYKILRSFKLRIFLIIVLLGFFLCTILQNAFLNTYAERAYSEKTQEISSRMEVLAEQLAATGYFQDGPSEVVNAQLSLLASLYDGRMIVVDSGFHIVYDSFSLSIGKIMIAKEVMEGFRGSSVTEQETEDGTIEVVMPVFSGTKTADAQDQPGIDGVLLLTASSESLQEDTVYFSRQMMVWELILLLLLAGIAFVLSALLVKPFAKVTQALDAVASFEDETPVVSDYTETEEIVEAFNKLRARMKVLDDSRQEFVSNVSHELRTPITSIKVLADTLNVQEDAPVEMYKEFMVDIASEIDREDKIISDLLSLVRMDQGKAGLNIESVDINDMMERIFKRLGPIARKNEVDLIFESHRAVTADIDEVKLTLALTNLIENGIKYNKHPGWVKAILDADHQYMTVEVTDCGIGIPEESLDHIFERFYRVDKSHSREIGGTGLGLAITRKIILLHRGSIQVSSRMDEGTTFMVKIPLSYIA